MGSIGNFSILSYVGLGSHMLSSMSSLYSTPQAVVRINEALSDYFALSNSTRQDCPLSLLISVLILELLFCMIGANPNIQGIIGKSGHHKAKAYKDDLLFMVSTPEVTLPNLMFIFL